MPVARENWQGLHEGIGNDFDGDGTRNKNPVYGPRLRQAAEALTHIAAVGRSVFSQAFSRQADSPNTAVSPTVVWRFTYDQRNANGQDLGVILTFLPIDHVLGVAAGLEATCTIVDEGAAVTHEIQTLNQRGSAASPVSWPEDLLIGYGNIPVTPSAAMETYRVEINNGFRLMSICVYERKSAEWPDSLAFLSGTDYHVEPSHFDPGVRIQSDQLTTDGLVQLRETEDEIFHNIRDNPGFSQPTTNVLTGANGAPVQNVVDGTLAQSAISWGIPVPSISGGTGLGATVEADVWIYARGIGGNAVAQAESSQGTVAFPAIGAWAWYQSSTQVDLDTTANDRVDIQMEIGAGTDWELLAAFVDINPV